MFVDALDRDKQVLAVIVRPIVRPVSKPDPVVDVGAGHVTGENHVVEDDQVNRRIVGLEVEGAGERVGRRIILKRAVPVDGDLRGDRINQAVNHPVVVTAELFCSLRRDQPGLQQEAHQQRQHSGFCQPTGSAQQLICKAHQQSHFPRPTTA